MADVIPIGNSLKKIKRKFNSLLKGVRKSPASNCGAKKKKEAFAIHVNVQKAQPTMCQRILFLYLLYGKAVEDVKQF